MGRWLIVAGGGRGRSRIATVAGLALLLACVSLVASGCWNRREIESLAFVNAAGIDVDPASGLITLSTHIVRPEMLGEHGQEQRPYSRLTSTGRTVFEAARNAIQQSPAKLFWAHNNVVIIGEATARQGIALILDFLERDGETRHDVLVVVARGATAAEMLEAEYETKPLFGTGLRQHLITARGALSTSVAPDLHAMLVTLSGKGAEPVAARIELPAKPPGGDTAAEASGASARLPIIGGAAVFSRDRLVGWLEPLEVRGVLWLKGEVRSGLLVIPDPWQEGRHIGLELARSRSKVKMTMDGDLIRAYLAIEAHAYLGDVQAPLDPLGQSDFERAVQTAFEHEIRAEVVSALERCQRELRSDVFGLGSMLHRQNPSLWRQVEGRWGQLFPAAEVEIAVRARVLRSGTNTIFLKGH
jgi:spore germination protein KC